MTRARKRLRLFLGLSVVLLVAVGVSVALAVGSRVDPSPSETAPSSPLVLENSVLVFTDPNSVSFTLSGATTRLSWAVQDVHGQTVAKGDETPQNGAATVDVGRALPTGYYTVSVKDSSGDSISAAFGVTGPAPSTDAFYSVQTLSAHSGSVYSDNMDRLIPMLKDLGFSARRDSVYWSEYEKTAGVYATPPRIQQILDDDDKNNMELMWTAGGGNPLYDDGRLPSSADGIQAYADYIDAFLTEHPDVTLVEMFNEFNGTNNSSCGAKASCYIDIAKVVYPFVKERHPGVTIVAGGLAGVSLNWWRDFFSAGGADYGDAFSYHPYNLTSERLVEVAGEITDLIERNNRGVSKPLYMSEVGWSISTATTGNPAKVAGQAEQAEKLVYSFVAPQASPRIARVNWYQAVDYGSNDTEYNFGLFEQPTANVVGFQPKRAAIAFYVMRSQLDGYRFVRMDSSDPGILSYVFSNARGDVVQVLWRKDGSSSEKAGKAAGEIQTFGKKYVSIVNVEGERVAETSEGGKTVQQEVSSSPLFVTLSDSPVPSPSP